MAQLIGIKERKEALVKINKYLQNVELINKFLDSFDMETKEFEVSYKNPALGKKVKAPFITSDGRSFEQYAHYSRGLYVKKIQDMCIEFNIELLEQELQIINKYETQPK